MSLSFWSATEANELEICLTFQIVTVVNILTHAASAQASVLGDVKAGVCAHTLRFKAGLRRTIPNSGALTLADPTELEDGVTDGQALDGNLIGEQLDVGFDVGDGSKRQGDVVEAHFGGCWFCLIGCW